MTAKMSLQGLILSSYPYLRSAMVRFPFSHQVSMQFIKLWHTKFFRGVRFLKFTIGGFFSNKREYYGVDWLDLLLTKRDLAMYMFLLNNSKLPKKWLLEHWFPIKVTKQGKFHQANWALGETTHRKLEFLCVSDWNCIYEGILQIDSWGPPAWMKRASLKKKTR